MSEIVNPYRPPNADLVEATKSTDRAGRGARLAASLIDAVFGMVIAVPAIWYSGILEGFPNIRPPGAAMRFGAGVFGLASATAIHGWFVATRGQTVGKLLVGLRMVRSDGSRLSLGRWLGLRMIPVVLVGQIPVIGNILVTLDALFIFRSDRRCLHDHLADTIVVKAEPAPD